MIIEEKLKLQKHFTNVEKLVAEYLLEQRENIRNESARQIAAKTFTSPASITRLCQRLGYEGYNDFREDYLKEIEYLNSHFQQIDPNYPFSRKDTPVKVTNKIASLYKETVDDVLSLITMEQLYNILNYIKKARTIRVISVGNHVYLAYPFREKMMKIGKVVEIINAADLGYFQAAAADREDCFLFISYSGEINNLIRIAEKAKSQGASTICFTSYGNNSLATVCDDCLYVSTREKLVTNLGTYGVYLSVLYLFDVIYSIYFNENYEENFDKKVKAAKAFEQLRTSDNPILQETKDTVWND